jgi:hypothetical protein
VNSAITPRSTANSVNAAAMLGTVPKRRCRIGATKTEVKASSTPHPKKIQPTCEAPMFNGNGANASRVKKPTLYSSAVIAIVSSPG